jgi:hypothetical protein
MLYPGYSSDSPDASRGLREDLQGCCNLSARKGRIAEEDYQADSELLETTLAAFRFSRVPESQCFDY